ncbi:hypothetical protein [Prosthecobacter dejongeii]|uniref:CHASE3 domain sensor protein n=1 Tax=Prosthecobacter dejongeii TaxID=48465 RepID=A0A7W7YLY8_9BACT|nr:hypothetical protein [Prosthecobacter dejongeii]MBB5038427.1 CHASE3 domain sensor protein [Prosthecobacter dejongeii]
MTAAVCLECGRMKTGAWKACPVCRFVPESLEDRARHLITTDHYLKPDKLEAISREIQAGQKPQFVDEQVRAVMEQLEQIDKDPREKQRMQRVKLQVRLVLIALGALILSGIWLWVNRG